MNLSDGDGSGFPPGMPLAILHIFPYGITAGRGYGWSMFGSDNGEGMGDGFGDGLGCGRGRGLVGGFDSIWQPGVFFYSKIPYPYYLVIKHEAP